MGKKKGSDALNVVYKHKFEIQMETTQKQARAEFLRAIKKCATKVLSSLARDVLPHYLALNLTNLDASRRDEWSQTLTGLAHSKQNPSDASTYLPEAFHPTLHFESALIDWAVLYNLTDAWLISEAIATVDYRQRLGRTDDWAYSSPVVEAYDLDEAFGFTFDRWNIEEDTWSSYKAKATAAFSAQLNDYRRWRREVSNARLNAYQKREKQHFEMLAEYQTNNDLTEDDIATKYQGGAGLAASSVSEALTKTAALIGLTLRSARGRAALS